MLWIGGFKANEANGERMGAQRAPHAKQNARVKTERERCVREHCAIQARPTRRIDFLRARSTCNHKNGRAHAPLEHPRMLSFFEHSLLFNNVP